MNSSQTTFDSADNAHSAAAVAVRQPRGRLRSFVLWALIFVAGIVIGAASSVAYTRHVLLPQVITGTGRFEPEKATTRVSGRLSDDLDLDEEQSKKVREVVRSHFGRMHAFREELRPRFEEEMQRFRGEMAEVLTDEQFAEWEQHLDHLRREFFPHQPRGRRGSFGGGGHREREHRSEHDAHRGDHHHHGGKDRRGGRRSGPPHADEHHDDIHHEADHHGGDKPRGRGRRGDDSHADDSHGEKSGEKKVRRDDSHADDSHDEKADSKTPDSEKRVKEDSPKSDADHGEADSSESTKPEAAKTPESEPAKEDKTQADVKPETE